MVRILTIASLCVLCIPVGACASDLATNVYLGYGLSQPNRHGQESMRSITIEREGFKPRLLARYLPGVRAGGSLSYSDVVEPRSWFGHTYGDPNDRIRAEWSYLFLYREWRDEARVHPYVDLGTGPMWSNRRIPAATARFNFHSQISLGTEIANRNHRPLHVEYRFSHISNFEFFKRNPGWNVHSVLIGARLNRR